MPTGSNDPFGFGTNLLGSTTRPSSDPRTFTSSDTFAVDCSTPTSEDGTEICAEWADEIVGNLRAVLRQNGQLLNASGPVVAEDHSDGMLAKALQLAMQRCQSISAQDVGSANLLSVTLVPAPPEFINGMSILVRKGANPSGAGGVNIVVNGTEYPVQWPDASAIGQNEWAGNAWARLTLDSATNPSAPVWQYFGQGGACASPGGLSGLLPTFGTLTNTGATVSVSAGAAADSTFAKLLSLPSGGSWAVTNGNAINGYAGGASLPNSSTIHFFICRGSSGVGLFASTTVAPALSAFPTGYNLYYRRIFSVPTNSSGSIIPYLAREVEGGAIKCTYLAQNLDASAVTPPTSARQLYSMTLPSGIMVEWDGQAAPGPGGTSDVITLYVASPDEPDTAVASGSFASETAYNCGQAGDTFYYPFSSKSIISDTSGNISVRAETGVTGQVDLYTFGFKDFRR
jgi:hypothetical protein